ncbi:hypothetical protein [Nocardia puris]|uniref:hypothetical protein n=1 Tax=Nocardia puris TaxID=208602 RepID=UPI002E1DD577
MSPNPENAIDVVLTAIEQEASRGIEAARLSALARTLDSLLLMRGLQETPRPSAVQDAPTVVAAEWSVTEWLRALPDLRSVADSTGTIWQKHTGRWYMPGSEAGLNSDDLAARAPFSLVKVLADQPTF